MAKRPRKSRSRPQKSLPPGLFQKGGPQGPGRGPAKGHGGRPRSEFRARMGTLCESDVPEEILQDLTAEVRRELVLKHPDVYLRLMTLRHRVWVDAADRRYGKATQPIKVGPDDAGDLSELQTMSDEQLMQHFQKLRQRVASAPQN